MVAHGKPRIGVAAKPGRTRPPFHDGPRSATCVIRRSVEWLSPRQQMDVDIPSGERLWLKSLGKVVRYNA